MDFRDEKDIPVLADRLFNSYNHDILPSIIDNFFKNIERLPNRYSSPMPTEEVRKARQIMTLEVLVKFCQLSEDFAAFAIAFKQSFDDEKDEILGIYNAIAVYDVGQVMD